MRADLVVDPDDEKTRARPFVEEPQAYAPQSFRRGQRGQGNVPRLVVQRGSFGRIRGQEMGGRYRIHGCEGVPVWLFKAALLVGEFEDLLAVVGIGKSGTLLGGEDEID